MSEHTPSPENAIRFEHLPPAERVKAVILFHLQPLLDQAEPDPKGLELSYETVMHAFRPAPAEAIAPEEREEIERFLGLINRFADMWQAAQMDITQSLEGRLSRVGERVTVYQVATASDSVRERVEAFALLARERSDVYPRAVQLLQQWRALCTSIRAEYDRLTTEYGASFWTSVAKHVSSAADEDIPLDD